MQLLVRDAAKLLEVSEKTIYRWVQQGKLPAYRVNDQYRFNKSELLEWATSQKVPVSPEIFAEPEGADSSIPSLTQALQAGGIHYRIAGNDKPSVLAAIVQVMPLPEEVNRDFLLQVLLARESLGSTGVGDGLAIPHVRNPIVLHIPRPMITLCFLETPIDFAAIDGRPVHTLFTLISPTVRAHLSLLSRLAWGLREGPFKQAIARQGSRQELLDAAAAVESEIRQGAPAGAEHRQE